MKVPNAKELAENNIFSIAIMILALVIIMLVLFKDIVLFVALPLIIIVIVLMLLFRTKTIVQLKEFERIAVHTFGRISRVSGPGWAIAIPLIETYDIIDLRTQVSDIPKQDVVTKNSVEIQLDAVIYWKINKDRQSIINSIVNVKDIRTSFEMYIKSAIRDLVGSMTLTDLISNVESLNENLKNGLKTIATDWGVVIETVQIKDIDIPKSILQAVEQEAGAEKLKQKKRLEAEGDELAIEAIKRAAKGLDEKTLAYYYIKALEKMSEGPSTKIIFPIELLKLAENISGKVGGAVKKDDIVTDLIDKYQDVIRDVLDKKPAEKKKTTKEN